MSPDSLPAGARLTVDLDALVANHRDLQARVAPAKAAAVVKADAYGLGLEAVAPALAAAGVETFFVALPEEGARLRRCLPAAEIAVLGGLFADAEAAYHHHGLVPVLNTLDEVARWRVLAARRGGALAAMLHVDTGMNRLGLTAAEVAALTGDPGLLTGIAVTAVLSHFACADEAGHPMTEEQAALFRRLRGGLPAARTSLANSSGIFRDRAYHLDLVRPGVAVYGGNPTPEQANPMRPVVRLEARVLQVRRVDSPMTVGYGAIHRVREPGKTATIAIGYADGYRRALGGRAVVRLAGRLCPVVGRISMDLTTIDVSALEDGQVTPGDWATLLDLGPPAGAVGLDADALAAGADTISYEILTGLGRRFRRRHVASGTLAATAGLPDE